MYRNLRNRSTIPALFARMVTQHPDKPALIYEATGEVRNKRRLHINSALTASAFSLRIINRQIESQTVTAFPYFFIPGLEFQGPAGAVPCCGSLGPGSGVGRGRRGSPVHGEPAFSGGSMVGSGYGRRRGRSHKPQPPTALAAALCWRVWCSGNGIRDRDERRYSFLWCFISYNKVHLQTNPVQVTLIYLSKRHQAT